MGSRKPHNLAAPYALDALEAAERRRFERHLEGCDACRQEVRALEASTSRLAFAVSAPAPAAMRSRVMAAVAATPQERPVRSSAPEPQTQPARGGGRRAAQPVRTRPAWPFRFAVGLATACLAGVAVLGVQLVRTQDRLDQAQAREQQRTSVLTAPDARTASGTVRGGGNATVVASEKLNSVLFVGQGLPEVASNRTYELWFMDGDQARPAGLLRPGSDGRADPLLAQGLGGAGRVALTVEPSGGSEQPTSDPIMVLELPARA